ncbi:MAG: ABC transporter substrate-binding protein [Lachnospiraceae bacterium]
MHKKRVYAMLLLLILAVSQLLLACGTAAASADEEKKGRVLPDSNQELLVVMNGNGTSSELIFQSVWLNRSKFFGSLLFRGLLIADENINNVKTDLCEEYAVSPDGLTYVFTIRNDVIWHDGEKFTPKDVVWSIENCLKAQETNGYVRKGLLEIAGAQEFIAGEAASISGLEVEGVDLTIHLAAEDRNFLPCVAQLAILPSHCFTNVSAEEIYTSDFWKMPVGTGPYKIISNENKEAVFILNESYTGKTPGIEQIRCRVVEDKELGDFDFTLTSDPDIISQYRKEAEYEVVQINNLYYRYLIFNLDCRTGENKGILEDEKVRKALLYGLDRKSMINNLYKGSALNIDCGVPEYDSWYVKKDDDEIGYGPTLSKKMLEEAGFDFEKTLVLTCYDTDELSMKILENTASDWEKIGVKTKIVTLTSDRAKELFVEADWYDIALKNLSAVNYAEWYYEYSGDNALFSNIMGKHNGFDVLLNDLDNSHWAYEKAMLYKEMQKLESELVYKIPLAIVPQYVIYRKDKLEIPDMDFPNMWFYFDLKLPQWKLLEPKEKEME